MIIKLDVPVKPMASTTKDSKSEPYIIRNPGKPPLVLDHMQYDIARGMLLAVVSKGYLTVEEAEIKYNQYWDKVKEKWGICPGFTPDGSIEDQLEFFVDWGRVKKIITSDTKKYKLASGREYMVQVYLPNKELQDILQ